MPQDNTLFQLLIEATVSENAQDALFILDENTESHLLSSLSRFNAPCIITNRFDLYEQLRANNISTDRLAFSDFNFNLAVQAFDAIAYRISKEKPLTNWCLNKAAELLKPSGKLILAGKKEDGLKSYVQACNKKLGLRGKEKKHGNNYLTVLEKTGEPLEYLDDKDYPNKRKIAEAFNYQVYSKPGQFGWQKIDAGSALLTEVFAQWLADKTPQKMTALDLGCGYGFLSLALCHKGVARIIASDNNAAALESCEYNLSLAGHDNFQVIPADCAGGIEEKADLILCNPPFHQGFDNDHTLTGRFVSAAARALNTGGQALFVVNAFIPLEKAARPYFKHCEQLQNNNKFKVLLLRN